MCLCDLQAIYGFLQCLCIHRISSGAQIIPVAFASYTCQGFLIMTPAQQIITWAQHCLCPTVWIPNIILSLDKKFPAKNRPRLILGKTGKIIILLFFLNILLLTHIIRASHSKKFSSFIGPVKRQNRTMLRATRRWGSNLAAHGLRSAPHLLLSLLVGSGSALWKEQTPEVNTAGKPERFSECLGHRGSAQRLHSKNPPGKPRGGDRGRNCLGVLYWARLHIQQAPGSHWWQFNFAMQDNFLNKMIPEL